MTSDLNKGIAANGIEYNHLNMPTKITVSSGSNTGTVDYVYSADRMKLRKINSNGTTTDYAGSFVYENGNLKQFNTAEGYVEPKDANDYSVGFQYVYRYSDVWGNTRITYADDNGNGTIETGSSYSEIRREQNYYPFGLEHKGYNTAMNGVKNNLKTYQKQEFTEDLGLNTHEWKYRMSDPAIGRFWQVDPKASNYPYNSTYAFQENKLGIGIELEGAENWPTSSDPLLNQAITTLNTGETSPEELTNTSLKSTGAYGAGVAAGTGGALAYGAGVKATVGVIANEVKDEVLSVLTDGASDIIDLSKNLKNLAKAGFKKLFGKADNVATDFVVTPDGTTVSTDLNKVTESFDNAGFNKVETNPKNSIYEVPKSDGDGTYYSRVQQGNNPRKSDVDGNRIVNTQNTGNTSNKQYVNPNGSNMTGNPSKSERRATGHIQLEKPIQ